MSAFDDGVEAYHRGDGTELNPYDDHDAQFDEWEDGWFTARNTYTETWFK